MSDDIELVKVQGWDAFASVGMSFWSCKLDCYLMFLLFSGLMDDGLYILCSVYVLILDRLNNTASKSAFPASDFLCAMVPGMHLRKHDGVFIFIVCFYINSEC